MTFEERLGRLLKENNDLRQKLRGSDGGGGGPHDTDMDARVGRLEGDMRELKATLGRLEPLIVRLDEQIRATLPHLATKADLADKPGKAYLWAILAALVAAYAAGLAGLAILK